MRTATCFSVLAGVFITPTCVPGLPAAGLDPVVERIREHDGPARKAIVRVVGPKDVPRSVWQTVRHLVAYRIHRPSEDDGTVTDAATYLVGTSDLYHRAATVLRTNATGQDDVWCLLAAVLTHEAAHTVINTEREALRAEAAQIRDCVMSSHLSAGEALRLASSLSKIEGRLKRLDREMSARPAAQGDR